MMTNMHSKDPTGEPKAAKRSLFGLLFNPQLGPTISPLRETTRIFVQVIAMIFSLYNLLPKDYPGLRDPQANLSLSAIIRTGWDNVRFTREGAQGAILYFAVTGILAILAIVSILALLSLSVGHAHAQGTDAFTAEGPSDVAQAWLNYLFIAPSAGGTATWATLSDLVGDGTANMLDPFAGGIGLQKGLIRALGFYSEAILIIAALILFYHLVAMVVDTAHSGVPMGKNASQVWAPIRLVVAIGLLVPVNQGLNSGQFIVVKLAELGSGLASHTWDVFLNVMASSKAVAPRAPMLARVASDIIRMQACMQAWNVHLTELTANGGIQSLQVAEMQPRTFAYTLGNIAGQKTTFSSNSLADLDVCGWYFVPNGTDGATFAAAVQVYKNAITASQGAFNTAALEMRSVINQSSPTNQAPTNVINNVSMTTAFADAVAAFQSNVNTNMSTLAANQNDAIANAVATMQPYGWVMAGTFLNAIDRIQATLASSARDAMPRTYPPAHEVDDKEKPSGFVAWFKGQTNGEAWNVRHKVAQDMAAYDFFEASSIKNGPSGGGGVSANTAQCAAMVGLDTTSSDGGYEYGVLQYALAHVDAIAQQNGLWKTSTSMTCNTGLTTANTFSLGIQFQNTDPFAQMAFLGHANLDVALDMLTKAMGSHIAAGGISSIPAPLISGLAAGFISQAGSFFSIMATIFFGCGFTLAYLVPLMPFMRFFFGVLSWIAAVIEAIVAIPLVALAHLNPAGDGLPGQSARGAYFFLFNLFLRPVLLVFGLVCGLIVFLVALSFLNYGYAVAAAGAGATVFGHAVMSRIIFSIVYVMLVYVCANHSFQLIDHLPEHALRWMGQSGQAMPKMGDASMIEQRSAVIGQIAAQQIMGAGNRGAEAMGGALQKGLQPKLAKAWAAFGDDAAAGSTGITQGQMKQITQLVKTTNSSMDSVLASPAGQSIVGKALSPPEVEAIKREAIKPAYN